MTTTILNYNGYSTNGTHVEKTRTDTETMALLRKPLPVYRAKGFWNPEKQAHDMNPYYKIGDVQNRLNDIFDIKWKLEIIDKGKVGADIYVQVRLHYPTEQGMAFKDAFGEAIYNEKLGLGVGYKSATSDALKRAADYLGIKCMDAFVGPPEKVTEEQIDEVISLFRKTRGYQMPEEKLDILRKYTSTQADALITKMKEGE